jgi:hypothetical protein
MFVYAKYVTTVFYTCKRKKWISWKMEFMWKWSFERTGFSKGNKLERNGSYVKGFYCIIWFMNPLIRGSGMGIPSGKMNSYYWE